MNCTFCSGSAADKWALSVGKGDAELVDSWRREIAPVWLRCHRLLIDAGDRGRLLKGTGETWIAGHNVGRIRTMTMGGLGEP